MVSPRVAGAAGVGGRYARRSCDVGEACTRPHRVLEAESLNLGGIDDEGFAVVVVVGARALNSCVGCAAKRDVEQVLANGSWMSESWTFG